MARTQIVLASRSPYRRMLLERLGLPFVTVVPGTDETPRDAESPAALAARLAGDKARACRPAYPDALIIGADQVAVAAGFRLAKPGGFEDAVAQLLQLSGRRVEFLTGLCLLDARSGSADCDVVPYAVTFRRLTREQVVAYVRREAPFDCVGGFKAEGLGVSLFERTEGPDPSALIGLPLIRLVGMLHARGVDVLLEGDTS